MDIGSQTRLDDASTAAPSAQRATAASAQRSGLGRLLSRASRLADGGRSAPEAPAADRQAGRSPILYWAPVWISFALLAQVALRGFGPALAESRRLSRAEDTMLARYEGAVAEQRELDRLLRAQSDPIYLERERRMLRTPETALLRR